MCGRGSHRLPAVPTLISICAAALSFWSGCGAHRGDALAAATGTTAAPLAVLLTTDCGVEIDDQWALTHILLSPELQLRAVVTTHASSVQHSSTASAAAAGEVLTRVAASRRGSIPVIPGASEPLPDTAT